MKTIQGLLMLFTSIIHLFSVTVKADYTLTVKFINYTNPSGLCAECLTRLGDVPLNDIVPVCCDEMPLRTDNCNNVRESRCDTRFRWILREYGGSLETRPETTSTSNTTHYFNSCGQSSAACPFSEMSQTFEEGDMAFLGEPNPFLVTSTNPWRGKIQFFIEPIETALPNIIDSFLINLDTLQLGADFIKENTYTGYHNISQMRMSFKLECGPNYSGPDCTVFSMDGVETNANITCVDDPSSNCTVCLQDSNSSANCSTCLNPAYDPATNCSTCVYPNFNVSTDCTTCLKDGYSPTTNCSLCSTNRDLSTNCTVCLLGWDIDTNCTQCLHNRNLSMNCITCQTGYTGEDCLAVTESPTIQTIVTTVSAAVIGGAIGGALLVVIIILIAVVSVLVYWTRRQGSGNGVSGAGDRDVLHRPTDIDMKQNIVYGVTQTARPRQPATDNIELQPNVVYGVTSTLPDTRDQTTCGNGSLGPTAADFEYIQI